MMIFNTLITGLFVSVMTTYSSAVCITEQGTKCIFPFTTRGVTYTTCTYDGNFSKPWCSTKVDSSGNTVLGNWGNCPTNNADCPNDRDTPPPPPTTKRTTDQNCLSTPVAMNLDIANTAVNAAIQKANQMSKKFCIAILDTGANLVAFSRMDRAPLGSMDVAMKKAKTSALFGVESSVLGVISQPGGTAYGADHTNGGLVGFGGGVPLKSGSEDFIGAIGVSGGTVDEDVEAARAAAKAVNDKY